LIEEAKRLGLKLVLPKVGISDAFRWVVKENKLYVPFIEIKGVGEKTAEACMNIKAKGSKKGFFESVQVQEKKTKIEKILEQIGAFGNEPTGDVEEYFTFTVNGRINHKKGYSKIFQKTLPVNERVLSCERCELCQECSSPVLPSPGYFNIMICGEAPGKDEDRLGKGFVGKSGQDVLWPALKEHGLKRFDFHITNICKCYPSQSKTPTREHITKCKRWLENEIEYLKPALILAFGNTGLKAFTNKESGIMDLNGKIEWNDKYQTYICWCIHPSAVLRNPSNKKLFVEAIDAFVDKIKELGGI
jgi:DNA polymerase